MFVVGPVSGASGAAGHFSSRISFSHNELEKLNKSLEDFSDYDELKASLGQLQAKSKQLEDSAKEWDAKEKDYQMTISRITEQWRRDNEVNGQKIEMLDRDKGALLKNQDNFKNMMKSYIETNEKLKKNNQLL